LRSVPAEGKEGMKRFITLTVFSLLVFGTSVFAVVEWGHDYDAALETAKKDKKLVMVDLYTDWCGWCKKLDKDTYSDKDVEAKLTKDFVAVKVNPEKSQRNAKLSSDLGTTGFPHIVFIDANGKKVAEIDGYLPAAQFLEQLNRISEKATKK
jgi:thiol:disulfide interchange protein